MRLRVLAAPLLLVPLCGCFVFDELDASEKLMGVKKESEAQEAEKAAAKAGEKPANWWEKASALTPEERDASIVGCKLGGKLQFMREVDCRTRGGRPQRG